uniref:PSP1 C-terminal domain-containing protein n=1 Tax=candidate division WOR-3 bacterium TaxID=2052148 RepID=A0A7C4XA55_UNCW3
MRYELEITPFWKILASSDDYYPPDTLVLFQSAEGVDVGRIINPVAKTEDLVKSKILRPINPEDQLKIEELKEYEDFCFIELKNAIEEFKLDMKIVYTHCQFDEERVIFYFTSERKIKFRKLHRHISQRLNKRVVIKQIGSRDYARILGGIGPCGRNLCCAMFLKDLKSISLGWRGNRKFMPHQVNYPEFVVNYYVA